MAVSYSTRASANLRTPLSKTRGSDPHPIFVIVLVGPEEQPFGIQLDFLCFKSSHYRRHFAEQANAESLEHLVRLPDTPVEVFAFAQNFLFTGQVFPSVDNLPSYEILIGVWKLGHDLGIDGLCDATLEAMAECRRITQHIPATPLLVQVWQDTPKGSSIRKLLLSWAAEYIRSSQTPNDFADTLPKEILSELVVAMRSDTSPPASAPPTAGAAGQARRSVHYLEDEDAQDGPSKKRQRNSESLPNGSGLSAPTGPSGRKPLPSRPTVVLTQSRNAQKRRSVGSVNDLTFTNAQKLDFCADLLTRMLSGPGASFCLLSLPAKDHAIRLTKNTRILDSSRRAVQISRESRPGRRARLLRQGGQADGPRHDEGQDGSPRVRRRGCLPHRHEPDLPELLYVLEERGPDVELVREAAEDVPREVRADEQVDIQDGRRRSQLGGPRPAGSVFVSLALSLSLYFSHGRNAGPFKGRVSPFQVFGRARRKGFLGPGHVDTGVFC